MTIRRRRPPGGFQSWLRCMAPRDVWLLAMIGGWISMRRVAALSDLFAKPFANQASTEVPIIVSFTTGQHPAYGQATANDDTVKMKVSVFLKVWCRPEIAPCTYTEIGVNDDCRKVLEAPRLPYLHSCVTGPFGILTLKLKGTLERNTQYNLLVLGTMPPAGKRIEGLRVKTLSPADVIDIQQEVPYEEAYANFNYPMAEHSLKHVTALELITPTAAQQGVTLQQYILKLTGSDTKFTAGDQIIIFSSPFIFPDEGFSFGGPCDAFDTSGFAEPLRDVTCEVSSIVQGTRAGFNSFTLTFGVLSTLAKVPQYFRISLNTPKHMGNFGSWYAASKDAATSSDFLRAVQSSTPFPVVPVLTLIPDMSSVVQTFGYKQKIFITIFPNVDILGDTDAFPLITVTSPSFHEITVCNAIYPEIAATGIGTDRYCLMTFKDNMNLYAHQSVIVEVDVTNPSFPIAAEPWIVAVQSGDGNMKSSTTVGGWPVYASLAHAFVIPLSMEFSQVNELQIFFCPSQTSSSEPRVMISAPMGFFFIEPCQFNIMIGFPRKGVKCSTPLSASGRTLFILRMPIMTVFKKGEYYASTIYPIANPAPGTYTGSIDSSPFRMDILSSFGGVEETMHNVPMGPHLRGFTIYPRAMVEATLTPTVRTPDSENLITLRFRMSGQIYVHGERLLITAPYGYRWKVGGAVSLKAGLEDIEIGELTYDESYPPVVAPHNQIEIVFVNPEIMPGTDLTFQATLKNAPIDPILNEEVRSSDKWILETYEPGAGFTTFAYRHEAVVFSGFSLQAITGGSISAWLPYASRQEAPIGITFRLGTTLEGSPGEAPSLMIYAPEGFYFPLSCRAGRISPMHLEAAGYTQLPVASIDRCEGLEGEEGEGMERWAVIFFKETTMLYHGLMYAFLLYGIIPDTLPEDNYWLLRSRLGQVTIEEEKKVQGFRLATQFLQVTYHLGTYDIGEDLRVGATDNRVMISIQPSTAVALGGILQITAPFRFAFAIDCSSSVYDAEHILNSLGDHAEGTSPYYNLPKVAACLGGSNTAQITFLQTLDVALRYAFQISVSNPIEPHPEQWPFDQSIWRFQTFDPSGAPLNAAQVEAFYLWAFAHIGVFPVTVGATEKALVTIEIQPSLTIPARGFLMIAAPGTFVFPVPCLGFQRDTYSVLEGFQPLPPDTECERGPGGVNVVNLVVSNNSYLAATVAFRFRLIVDHPVIPSADRQVGVPWIIISAEQTELGASYLERSPAVTGYPTHRLLKSFSVSGNELRAERVSKVTVIFALPQSMGTFDVVTTTEDKYVIVRMPVYYSVPVVKGPGGVVGLGPFCEHFQAVYPEGSFFPSSQTNGCLAQPDEPEFRLHLFRDLIVGPDYAFTVGVMNPSLDALRQRQVNAINIWRILIARKDENDNDVVYATRSTDGYTLQAALPNAKVRSAVLPISLYTETLISFSFILITELRASRHDSFRIKPPKSTVVKAGPGELCQLWISRTLQSDNNFQCSAEEDQQGNPLLIMKLKGSTVVPEENEVQIDFRISSGAVPLPADSVQGQWGVQSENVNGTIIDQAHDLPGFIVDATFELVTVIPKDVIALSFVNHAEFRFTTTVDVSPGSGLRIYAPSGFVLFPMTLRDVIIAGEPDYGGLGQPALASASYLVDGQRDVVVVNWPYKIKGGTLNTFRLTIGNAYVSPPDNDWTLAIVDESGTIINLNSRVPGFLVESEFNVSSIEAQIDEPLVENYIHVQIAVNHMLVADSIESRKGCTPTVDEPLCPGAQGLATYLVIVAPSGFVFAKTCGYWVLKRVGGRHHSLPPGSLCRGDPLHLNIARIQVSQSLEAGKIYEFSIQVRNALAVPQDNYWNLYSTQDGVMRERNETTTGIVLRTLRTVQVLPSNTLAGAVDNTVTFTLRSEYPVTGGAMVLIVAPEGFIFDPSSASSLLDNPIECEAPAPGMTIRSSLQITLHDDELVPPNEYFHMSVRTLNPRLTPEPNYWTFYVKSKDLEHIDLYRFFLGFAMSYPMKYVSVYPNVVPWEYGTSNDVSIFFVTQYPLFVKEYGDNWQIVLVAPKGFEFPTRTAYTKSCSGFIRSGGKDTYDQLPQVDPLDLTLTCNVRNRRSVVIDVPTVLNEERRYSFKLNIHAAEMDELFDWDENWKLTILQMGEIAHLGESLNPLLGQFYEPTWFWIEDQTEEVSNGAPGATNGATNGGSNRRLQENASRTQTNVSTNNKI